jgi:hypothetical protein
MTPLEKNLERLEAEIAAACRNAGRARAEVELMAVSKTHPAATVAEAAALGLTFFGENRVQEFAAKSAELAPLRQRAAEPVRVHLIGHLQSNKALRAVEIFDGIDSVDSLRLAQRLNEAAAKLNKRLPDLVNLQTRGLMTIAPLGVSEAETRACFRSLREWRVRWAAAYPPLSLDVLSMGMSGDFALAIAEGATRIRVGSALFGARSYAEPA